MSGAMQITLERDGHDQPWGFRLQGGHDVGFPLSIQRILVGTPAEGVLKKGDIIQRIGQNDTKGLTHQQAADLFTNAGNQIQISLKRVGPTAVHSSKNATTIAAPQSVPIGVGVPLPGLSSSSPARSPETLYSNLPKSRSTPNPATSHQVSAPTSPLTLTIQNQPYRTSPLIQPSAKIEIGPGSVQHLRMQAEYLTGTKESQPPPDHKQAKEYEMKQKVAGTLQNLQHTPQHTIAEPETNFEPKPMPSVPVNVPAKHSYNNPINLYSHENVAEVARLNQMGLSGAPPMGSPSSPTGLIHPNKPHTVVLNPTKEYNPKESATWQALQESDPGVDPSKVQAYSSLKEHDPVFSEVYAAPKQPQFAPYHKSNSTQPPGSRDGASTMNPHKSGGPPINNPHNLGTRSPAQSSPGLKNSPVVEFLPSSFGGKVPNDAIKSRGEAEGDQEQSSVLLAALEEDDSRPRSISSLQQIMENLPIFETTSIGGRRRIAQSSSFNKLMMDVLGE